jgi:hypothetical protein
MTRWSRKSACVQAMRSLSPQQRRRPPPIYLAVLVGLGSAQASCDSQRGRGGASGGVPAASARPLQMAKNTSVSSALPVQPAPSASSVVPKEQFTVEEPRCAPNEADCLPEPYNGSEERIVGTLTGAPYKYNASRERYPLREGSDDDRGCEHDGDCSFRSCVACVSRLRVPPSRQCPAVYSSEFDGAFCGCVEKRCRWFTQRLTERVVTSTKDLEVRIGGALATDAKFVSAATEFFRPDLANCYDPRKNLLPVRHRFVMTVGKYGEAGTDVSGVSAPVRKCVSDAFEAMTQELSWISDDVLKQGEIRFSGLTEVKMAWVP